MGLIISSGSPCIARPRRHSLNWTEISQWLGVLLGSPAGFRDCIKTHLLHPLASNLNQVIWDTSICARAGYSQSNWILWNIPLYLSNQQAHSAFVKCSLLSNIPTLLVQKVNCRPSLASSHTTFSMLIDAFFVRIMDECGCVLYINNINMYEREQHLDLDHHQVIINSEAQFNHWLFSTILTMFSVSAAMKQILKQILMRQWFLCRVNNG